MVISYKDVDGKNKTKWVSTGFKEGTGKLKLEEKRKSVLTEFEEMYNRKIYDPQTDKNGFTPVKRYRFRILPARSGITSSRFFGGVRPDVRYSICDNLSPVNTSTADLKSIPSISVRQLTAFLPPPFSGCEKQYHSLVSVFMYNPPKPLM